MSDKFINAMTEDASFSKTTNGMTCRSTTGSYLLDFFASLGALRQSDENAISSLFYKAFDENPELSIKSVFYGRDLRGGLGERRVFRVLMRYIACNHPQIARQNLHLVPFYGRWDDLYVFVGTPVEQDMWKFMSETFFDDLKKMKDGKPISLLAKWMKCWNSGNAESRSLGRKTAKALHMSDYRLQKTLAKMRSYLRVVEVKMSANEWNDISYENVPSRAMTKYRRAFARHDEFGFSGYISAVSRGEKKINASTLYPYDLVGKYLPGDISFDYSTNRYAIRVCPTDDVVEAQWKALPNYIEGENNVLVMVDTSGSMRGMPINSAVGLGIYFAERNNGPYKNKIMSFSDNPVFVDVVGQTLNEKVRSCLSAHWMMNTNISAAMQKILDVAIENRLSNEDVPKALIIVSDMQFDECASMSVKEDFYTYWKREFAYHGYEIPNVVFWNVNGPSTFHAKKDVLGVQMFSGHSVSTFKDVLSSITMTPYDAMVKVLTSERYSPVKI